MLGVRVCITWSIHVHVVHLTEMLLHIITKYGAFRPHPLLIILPPLPQIYFLDRTLDGLWKLLRMALEKVVLKKAAKSGFKKAI